MTEASAPAGPGHDLHSPEVQFLTALWDTWQALVSAGEARLYVEHALDLRGFIALSYLQAGPQQPADLARELGVPRYETSRVLSALERLGAVTRERGGADARGVTVRITPAGRERWAAALHTVRAVAGPPLARLSAPDSFHLIRSLQAVAHARSFPHDPASPVSQLARRSRLSLRPRRPADPSGA